MSLMRWREPREEMRKFKDDVSSLFEDFFGRPLFPALWRREAELVPAVDVYETDEDVVVKLEVPGAEKEDIEVSVSEQEITIKGEVKQEEETKEEGFYRRERRYGSFSRTIPLPATVDTEGARATFKEGVLQVRVPKPPEEKEKVRRISIE